MTTPAERKRHIRTELRRLRASIPAEERKAQGEAAARLLLSDPRLSFPHVQVAYSYMGMGSEMPTASLVKGLAWRGVKVLAPVAARRSWHRLADVVAEGGNMLARPRRVFLAVEHVDLFVVPGLAWDTSTGMRLGQGGGFFDRLLARACLGAWSVGLAFDCQIVKPGSLPVEGWDVALDAVATHARIYEPKVLQPIPCRSDASS